METVKVYLAPPAVASPSLSRVSRALAKHKPKHVQIVEREEEADLTILHVIGRQDQVIQRAEKLRKYAVIQYAIRSTLRPSTKGWVKLWDNAQVVWSYYNLPDLCREDGVLPHFDFYHSPLGVDWAFRPTGADKKYLIGTSGQSYLTESVRECVVASEGKPVFHLGNDVKRKNVTCISGISDSELANYYSECLYVSGLRRVEGFELPALEGLMCGARPIFFDRPHYRQWFNNFAIFIPEEPREKVVESLKNVFKSEYRPVSRNDMLLARERFNWEPIIKGFWEKAL